MGEQVRGIERLSLNLSSYPPNAPLSVFLERSGFTGADNLNAGQQTIAGRLAILLIGSNGLAHPRDFHVPVAAYEDREGAFELVAKFMGNLWSARIGHSPLDVVAWHGNYAPYKYDLRRFNTIGSISYDHPDPSIFLVLQSQSDTPGVDAIDFVIFPPRILAMEHTFRPPWFHRNVASEFMGLLQNENQFGLMAVSLGYSETLMSCSASSTSSEMPAWPTPEVGTGPVRTAVVTKPAVGAEIAVTRRWASLA